MITKMRVGQYFSNGELVGSAYDWRGLSTDTKPTDGVSVNDLFLEVDSGKVYFFDGEGWTEVG